MSFFVICKHKKKKGKLSGLPFFNAFDN